MTDKPSKVFAVGVVLLAAIFGLGCDPSASFGLDAMVDSFDASIHDGGDHSENYGLRLKGAYCSWLERCNTYLFLASGGAVGCVDNYLQYWEGVVEYRSSMARARRAPPLETQVEQCIAQFAAADCSSSIISVASICPTLATGFVGIGGRCGGRGECIDGADCFAAGGEACGSCEQLPVADEPCRSGLCKQPFSCLDGLCRRNGKPGELCGAYDCDPLYECVETGVCRSRILDQPGDPCNRYCDRQAFLVCANSVCVEGLVFVGRDAQCDEFSLCSGDLVCLNARCKSAPAPGEPCPSFACNWDGRCDPATQMCIELGIEGALCSDDFECDLRLRCLGGQCRQWSLCE